jgi:hypothetical protein
LNENRGTILEKKYDKLTDSEQVLWRKDEKETSKGVKRVEIQKVKKHIRNYGTFCIMGQQLNYLSELK